FLYFASLYLQIDAYAGRENVVGLAEEDIPSLAKTIAEGWFYLGAFALLIFLLIFLQQESIAPYYATAALLVLNQFSPKHRLDLSGAVDLMYGVGKLLIELVVVLAGVGLIVGSLSLTGLSGTLVNDLLSLAGDDIGLLLFMGAITSFVLGIGMTVTAAYIFLAVVLAPALVSQDLNALSVHLFILYWAMLSYITPPVALGAYAAASIAEANPLKTGFAAMRLGSVIYIIPFIFVLDVAFILQGPWYASAQVFAEAIFGVWLICAGLQGYLAGLGRLDSGLVRLLIGLGGLVIAMPQLNWVLAQPPSNAAGLVVGVAMVAAGLLVQRFAPSTAA
ncbi:MAG: TRAP transporter large permease subunit, partial [Proteobacteria bacterium]|nr:TRAP transporter large permease subunit [Pseudomonadota bacterium]